MSGHLPAIGDLIEVTYPDSETAHLRGTVTYVTSDLVEGVSLDTDDGPVTVALTYRGRLQRRWWHVEAT